MKKKMVDLARTADDRMKDPCAGMVAHPYESENDKYGIRINLTESDLEKLDLDLSDIEKDDELHFTAVGKIDSYGDGSLGKHVCLCITHMGIEPEGKDSSDEEEEPEQGKASKRYGGDEEEE